MGGCVRDALLCRKPADWDIATNARPEQVGSIFPKHFDTGIKHGTVTVLQDGGAVEITTFRIDHDYTDNRHPGSVEFSDSFETDVKRRDFTINALGYNESEGIVDYVGGLDDLKNGIIRCVGEPDVRFREDALRILRALRFSSVLGFRIDDETFQSVIKNKQLLSEISAERIRAEIEKMFAGGSCTPLIHVCDVLFPELYKCFFCDQDNPYHIYNVGMHCLKAADCAEGGASVKYAALFHDIGKPSVKTVDENRVAHFYSHALFSEELARNIFNRLKLDNKTKKEALRLIKYHDRVFENTTKSVRRFLSKTDGDFFKKLLELKIADVKAQNPKYTKQRLDDIDKTAEILDEVLSADDAFSLKDLAVNGRDIMELGAKNAQIRFILNRLLTAVIDNPRLNEREKLLELAKNIINCH